ncbi:hypothetical protein SADUNF_Sadunf03G0036300 [Salix dunnii]|uniref:CRC domain-containing protein n=1 Tax=Salix dunnii TaxID=1413687 RepID=A0A835KFV4_9ROSI|nr:hypothetical protein SADUNF_Sadunf03G0036300 [Salix dunnii]
MREKLKGSKSSSNSCLEILKIMLSLIYFGGPIFEAQHHELFSSQVNKLICVHYVHIYLKKDFECEISVSFPLLYAYQNIELQAAVGQCDKLGASIHSFPESEAYKDSKESVRLLSKGYVKEADQLKRGIRRHLNFGAAIASKHTTHGTHESSNLCFPDSHKDLESFVTPHFEPRGISGIWQARSCAQIATLQSSFFPSECEPVRSAQNCGNRALSSRISSGGGLLLNKFVRSDSVGSDSSISKKLRSKLHQNKKLMSGGDHYLGKGMNSNPVLSFSGGIYIRMGGGQQKSQAAVAAGSSNYRSMSIMQTPRDSLHSIPFEQLAILCEGTRPFSENADIIELNQMIPERNREKAKYSTESEGCKRCNCERSRCLKFYCECSVAGIIVFMLVHVVKRTTNSPVNMIEEGNWKIPSSSRHRKGCNCKKSKCCKNIVNAFRLELDALMDADVKDVTISMGKTGAGGYFRDSQCNIKPNKFSSTLETLTDIGYPTPPSRCVSGVASSTSQNLRDCSKISQGQPQQESGLRSSSGYLKWRHSPCSLTSKLYGSELGSDSFLCNKLDDSRTETLKNTCTPSTKAVKSFSQLIRNGRLQNCIHRGLRSGRELILQVVPCFPPRTPYCKSQAGIHQNNGDHNGSPGYQ